jgi:hypothetical protein
MTLTRSFNRVNGRSIPQLIWSLTNQLVPIFLKSRVRAHTRTLFGENDEWYF